MSADRFGTKFNRLFIAVATPYKEDYTVDEPALRKFLQYFMQPNFVDAGGAIVINPIAGEVFCLSREEKKRNIEITMEECSSKVPIFAGVFELSTADLVKAAIDAKEAGVNGIFLMRPQRDGMVTSAWDANKNPEIWLDFLKAPVEATDLPAISTAAIMQGSGRMLLLEITTRACIEIPNIVGWKMAYDYNDYVKVARAFRAQ